ncbi:uncharacterized protein LOC142973575 [Anticarsia gemmatalis]|uniref:uncharacterized protein LOC142973575 n=1 Tax=Anticarsia gemmatalis TaxID=129554 RepID=UPI003F763D30
MATTSSDNGTHRNNLFTRTRSIGVTRAQLETLLSILEKRPHLVTRNYVEIRGRDNYQQGWKEITEELNQMPRGAVKTPEQWITMWRGYKSQACIKAANYRKSGLRNGNSSAAPLTKLDKRIEALVGLKSTMNQPAKKAKSKEARNAQNIEEVMSEAEPQNSIAVSPTTSVVASCYDTYEEQAEDQEMLCPEPQINESLGSSSETRPPQPERRKTKNNNPRRKVALKSLLAQNIYLKITKSRTESMKMLATAARQQSEAAKMQAEASFLFAQAANKLGDALLLFADKNVSISAK